MLKVYTIAYIGLGFVAATACAGVSGRDDDEHNDDDIDAGGQRPTAGSGPVLHGGGGAGGSSGAASAGASQQLEGGQAGTGSGMEAGAGGVSESGGAPAVPGPPTVEELTPQSGPYGTTVTLRGEWLGSRDRKGVRLSLGDAGEITLDPKSTLGVQSWTENEISIRFPFPAAGAVVLETPEGSVEAGEFQPSWVSAASAEAAPGASVIASISLAPQTITVLFDTDPPVLTEIGPEGAVERAVELGDADLQSVRLYAGSDGSVEGLALSSGPSPELLRLTNVEGKLVAEGAGLQLAATEFALAGGPDGATVWMHREGGWVRARPSKTGKFVVDKGPIVDPKPNGKNRAFGATSDGSLYIAWAVDTGNFLDDMEAPVFRRLGPSDTAFGAETRAGSSVDDYVTSLELFDKGRGLVVRYCGSDVDPTGLSGRTYRCYDALHAQGGGSIQRVPVDVTSSTHAFAQARAVAGACDSAQTFRLRTDTDEAGAAPDTTGEAVIYPCQTTVALEVDPDGQFVPLVRAGAVLHVLRRQTP